MSVFSYNGVYPYLDLGRRYRMHQSNEDTAVHNLGHPRYVTLTGESSVRCRGPSARHHRSIMLENLSRMSMLEIPERVAAS